jgi:mitochondrial fission protein ELM1
LVIGKSLSSSQNCNFDETSLPIHCFDYAIIPEHDGIAASDQVIVTQGALNPMKMNNVIKPIEF